jgi:hypothetical protein
MGQSYRKSRPTEGGIIVGVANAARLFGCHPKTIQRWAREFGFPLATLPNGLRCTSITLVDLWLLSRLPQQSLPRALEDLENLSDAELAARLDDLRARASAVAEYPKASRGRADLPSPPQQPGTQTSAGH